MIETICTIRTLFIILLIPGFLICLGAIIMSRIKKNRKIGFMAIGIFLFTGLIILCLNMLIEHKIRAEIQTKLLDDSLQEILINNESAAVELDLLKEAFLKIRKVKRKKGSGGTKKFSVNIVLKESSYLFTLFRNSYEPTKYHVKTNRYAYELDVGMINTSLLDETN